MSTSTRPPDLTHVPPARSDEPPGRVARAAPWLAGAWVVTYLPMALLHLVRDTPPPWTPTPASVLLALSAAQASVLIIVLGSLAAVSLGASTARGGAASRPAAWLLVAVGLVVSLAVSDVRALSFVGYAPMMVLALLGVGPMADASIDSAVYTDSLLALGSSIGGIGMVVTGAGLLARRTGVVLFRTPGRALRVGRWAVGVAALVPLCYVVTRLAWAVGIPLGVRDEFLDELGSAKWAGFGLAAFAVVGCLLTLGLVQRWGEVFWSWVPLLGGRPVPVGMAVVPALFVATIVTSAGLAFDAAVLGGHLEELPGAEQDWAAWAPELLWPVWGAALAVAALAYRSRRTVTR